MWQSSNYEYFKIAIIGSGNVATHLSLAFEKAGHQITTIYSRQLENAQQLAAKLKTATATNILDFTNFPPADIYIICVTDAAVSQVLDEALFPENSLIIHTSGSLPLDIFNPTKYPQAGIFYPIQTFSKNQAVNLSETPIALEATTETVLKQLHNLAISISKKVIALSSEERKTVHLAAVFACNFTNHLLGISREILNQKQLNPDILTPLIQTTLQKAFDNHPFQVQTGPAIRNDQNIILAHISMMQDLPVYQEIYQVLTKSIQGAKPGLH